MVDRGWRVGSPSWRSGQDIADERVHRGQVKPEIRNPNCRNPKEARNPKAERALGRTPEKVRANTPLASIRTSVIRISFGIRILNLGFWVRLALSAFLRRGTRPFQTPRSPERPIHMDGVRCKLVRDSAHPNRYGPVFTDDGHVKLCGWRF